MSQEIKTEKVPHYYVGTNPKRNYQASSSTT